MYKIHFLLINILGRGKRVVKSCVYERKIYKLYQDTEGPLDRLEGYEKKGCVG